VNQLKANTKQNTVSVFGIPFIRLNCPMLTDKFTVEYFRIGRCHLLRCMHAYNVVTLSVRPSWHIPGGLRIDSAPSLSNCGHTFCQGCLTDWFNTTLAHHRSIGARGMAPYTCPSCRLPARTPPVQNFSLKRIVRLAAESRGESSPRRPQAPPPPPMPPMRGRGSARRDSPPGPFDFFFWR
jgi:hypothetical protein